MENIMNFVKYLLSLVVAVGFTGSVLADSADNANRFDEELNERDWRVLRDFINSKRTIDVQEKSVSLAISGDVRTEWRHITEKQDGINLRSDDHKATVDEVTYPIRGPNEFDIELNLYFDYVCDRAWAVAHLNFDNDAGVSDNGLDCKVDPEGYHGSGYCDGICLKKAYMGYNLFCDECGRFDIELGRRGNLYNAFDSEIQFLSRLDGILFTYSSNWECVADWYAKAAGFVVDERVNHFAWVIELGFLNICDSGLDFKYSFIDWEKNGINRCLVHDPEGFKFLNSQFTLAYHFDPEALCVPAKAFGAFLINHAAERHEWTRDKRANIGWYVGFTLGEVIYAGDWAATVQYQVVQAQAIPDDDVSGIGRGNVLGSSVTTDPGHNGNTNYKGWRFEGLYALTDNLTIDTIIEWSHADDARIGDSHSYSKLEVEAVYAF